jgi:redox-sensitive bicupin YhaK (pirin superfamily)
MQNLIQVEKASFNFPANYTTALLVVEGSVKVNDQEVALDHFVIFEKDGEDFVVEATENCIALIISGEPLNEPIAAHGPFVMNTQEQIQEAFQDYNLGKFGFLED